MRVALLLGASLFACSRNLEVPASGTRSTGALCDQSGECLSGLCADGVCCASKCASTESCALPDHLGTCAVRALGAACSGDAQCGSGHCKDHVCCNEACGDSCRFCGDDESNQAGTCHDALDDTDARGDCGICSACFQRTCAPALPGGDPNHRCAAGQVCGPSQSCGNPGGAACAADGDCAVGRCFAANCEEISAEGIFVEPMVTNPSGRNVRAIAASPTGSVAVVFGEFSQDAQGNEAESDLFVALRSPAGVWSAVDLFQDRGLLNAALTADVSFLGPTAFVLAYNHEVSDFTPCAAGQQSPCGLFGVLVSPGAQAGRPEIIDGDVTSLAFAELKHDKQGNLVAAYDGIAAGSSDMQIFLRRRDVTAEGVAWTPIGSLAPPAGLDWNYVNWEVEFAGATPIVFLTGEDTRRLDAYLLPSTTPDPAPISGCSPSFPQAKAIGGNVIMLTINCVGGPMAGTWDPSNHFRLADFPGAQRVDPLGLVGGVQALLAFRDVTTELTVTEAHVVLRRPAGDEDWLLFHPRGTDDIDHGWATLGPDGLPMAAIVTGVPVDNGNSITIQALNLYLARFHP